MYQNYHVLVNLLPKGQQNIHETENAQTFGSPKAVGKYSNLLGIYGEKDSLSFQLSLILCF